MTTEQQVHEISLHLSIILEGEFGLKHDIDLDANVDDMFHPNRSDAYDFLDAICEYFQLHDIEQEVDITFAHLINSILALNPTVPNP